MKSNSFIKYGGILLIVILLITVYKSGSSSNDEDTNPPVTTAVNATSSDSGTATVTTLINRDAERESEVSVLKSEIQVLKDLVTTGNATENVDNSQDEVTEQLEEAELKINIQQAEIDNLAARVNSLADTSGDLLDEMKNKNFFRPNDPLGNRDEYEISNEDETIWTYPLDQRSIIDDGVFIAKNWLNDAGETIESSTILDDFKEEAVPKPVFTIPENTTLVGARLASRIIAQVPKSGAVNNPMGFKIVVPAKVLAANGFVIDQLKEAQMGGYAVGNWALKCARGYITSLTFIFEDGRIAQVGSNMANTGQDTVNTSTLAVLTDTAGTECVVGKLHTNAPEFITTKVLLGAAAGAASAYAGAQETVQQGSDSSSSSITGSTGKYIAGQAITDGVNQGSSYVDEIWKDTTDSVIVDIATEVNVEIKQAINIDYDPIGRKVNYDWNLEGKSTMEAYWR